MEAVHPTGQIVMLVVHAQMVGDVDTLDDENLFVDLHFSDYLGDQIVFVQLDTARLQRASQGSGESPAGSCDNVVERRGSGSKVLGTDTVVLGDLGVDPEERGLVLGRKEGSSDRPTDPLDAYSRPVNDL